MALVFVEGFDHMAAADVTGKGWSTAFQSVQTGRVGGQCARYSSGAQSTGKILPSTYGTLIVGFAIRTNNIAPAVGVGNGVALLTTGNVLIAGVCIQAGHFLVLNAASGTVITSVATVNLSVWYYIELKVFVNGASGTAELYVNGVLDTASTTGNFGSTNIGTVQLRLPNGANTSMDWDDMYACDTTGGAPTDTYLGDVLVEAIFPSGNGNSSVLVGSDGNSTDNYLLVDETTPSTADYVESSTVGNKDTYAFSNLTPTTGTVYGLQVLPYAAKTDAGTRSIVSVARLSATEVDSAVKTLSTSYQYLGDISVTKPGGGVWTISDVNSAEFGVKINA